MYTKPCMSSHNKRIIILIYTKDCSDTEGIQKPNEFHGLKNDRQQGFERAMH